MALLWPVFGPDLANMSGPPKCHHSTLHVDQNIIPDVPDVGRIWADNMLLSGNYIVVPPPSNIMEVKRNNNKTHIGVKIEL